MDMFRSVLETVPKTRSQMVNELEIPEDIEVSPYIWSEAEETVDSESLPSVSVDEDDAKTASSESSLALSRAMTDSEIDYSRYRRYKSRSFSDPWVHMRTALETFSPGYLDSLNSFQDMTSESTEDTHLERQRYNEELQLKMERFFEEECRVFSPDDPGLIALEEALRNSDLKDSEIDSNTS
ncbi:uncharacterized protein LOC123656455 [Melitaea cinxia]|uniref:uncharacterized protein LOC123656455 n=1 Tax=Melitaea cinxia TaxID=113334 RepID=UPI001E271BB5|nr:uncharacterized protein LOC123656455 [Melitaea cinxia]